MTNLQLPAILHIHRTTNYKRNNTHAQTVNFLQNLDYTTALGLGQYTEKPKPIS